MGRWAIPDAEQPLLAKGKHNHPNQIICKKEMADVLGSLDKEECKGAQWASDECKATGLEEFYILADPLDFKTNWVPDKDAGSMCKDTEAPELTKYLNKAEYTMLVALEKTWGKQVAPPSGSSTW